MALGIHLQEPDCRLSRHWEPSHGRRRDIDLEKPWDVESAAGKGVVYVTKSKNESSKRVIPLNQAARQAVERMLRRADALGHTSSEHYVWCASQHHQFDPNKPASKWDGAWHSLRKAAGLPPRHLPHRV
jgi:hypothetical protein